MNAQNALFDVRQMGEADRLRVAVGTPANQANQAHADLRAVRFEGAADLVP